MEDAQGVMRGGCRECSCRRYVLPMVNRCDYCNHLPIAHQELQPAPVAAPSSSSSTKLATSPRTKHLFQQQAPPSPAQQVSKPHRNGGNTSSSSLASDPLESASTAAAAASLLAYVEAQLHKRNGTTPSLLPPQDPPPAAATVLASQSSVDELLALLRAHLAGAPPSSTATATTATADAATSPTPHTTTSSPQPSATFSSTTSSGTSPVHTSSPASASSSTTPATPAASAGLGLLPTPLFPASPALAPPPTPPPQSSSALAAAAEANGVDCTAAPAVSAAGRRKKPAITAAAVVAAATKAVTVAATPATPAAAAADGQLNAKKNRARKRGARARSRSKVGGGLELPHAADASSTNSNGHPGDEEDDEAEAEAAFDDDHERDELDAEYADEPGLASTSHHHQQQQPQPHEAHSIPDEAAQSATTAMTGGQQQPEPFVRRNTGGRRRPQQEKVEELIPLSFLTNALFTPPPPQPQPSADVPAPVETKRVKGVGTGDPKFSITITKCVNKTLMFHTISAMPEYCGKSFEELRWEDYQLGNRGTQTRPSLFSLIDTSSPPYPLPSPATTVAFDRAPSPPPASLLPRSLQGFFDSAVAATDADADAQPPLDLLPPPPMPVACGHSARDEADADGGEEEERIIYRTPSKPLLDDKPASAPSPLVLTSSTSAPPAPHKEVDAAQLAPGSRLRARNAANRTRVTRLYEELYELVEQLGRQVAAAGDDGDTTTPAPLFEADALLHRIHAATRDYAFAPTAPAASVFTSGTPLSPPLFALPPPPHSPYSPLASASAAAAAAMGAPSPAPSPSPGFSALSPAPSAPVYTAFPPPASSPFALRSFPVPMDLSYFKRYYIKGSYVPFLEDFAHEFKDVARNKKEHYFAIINHPKLEANLSAFLNSRDGGTLYFGIHDSGQVIGVSITRDQLDSLKNMIWAKMETFNPVPDPHLYRIEIVPVCNARATALIKDLYVVEIHITGGTRLYFNREDRAWVRRDAGNHCLKSGAEVRDFIEQRGKERRQERRGEKRRSDHHDSPASSSSSSSSTSMDTNLDDGGGLTMRPLTPRAHSGSGSGIRGTLESGGVGAATTTTPGPASSASAALQPSPVPLLFPLRRPVHRDGRVAPVWLKTWSGTGPADGSQQATAAEAANPGDRRAAGEVTATASKKPKRATTPDNAVVDAVIYNAEAETEVGRSVTDATANICRHDGERGGEAEVEQGGEADHVQVAAAPDTAEKMTAAAPVGDEGLLDHRPVGVTNVETTDKREEVAKEENEVRSHTAQEAENCEQKMRDLEADLARLSADTSELVSLSWIPTPEAAATSTAAAASSDETMTHAASPDFLKEATAPASELKERPASPAAAVGDDATTANTNTEDGTDAEVALAAGGDVPSAAALVVVDDNDHQGQSGQRKTDVVAEEEDPDGHGEVEEEVKADEAILAFGPTLGVTSDGMRGASTAPAAATGALPPFSFADFSSSFFSSFSLPSSLYSPSPSTYSPAPLSATNTTAAPTSSSSSSSSPPSSPSPSASPALRSSTKRSLAAFLPSVGAKAGRMASPSLLPLPAAAAPLDATPTPGVDRGSTATATAAAADSEEKKVGKNRRKKEQRMLKSNGNRPAISTADTDEVRPTKTDHADGSADESESEGKTEENETEKEKEEKEKTMEAELEKLERELEADRRQFVAQFASCFADLAIGGASREADADDEAKAERVATSS